LKQNAAAWNAIKPEPNHDDKVMKMAQGLGHKAKVK